MHQASVLSYFFSAGMVVKSVMFILLIASVISWTLILQRYWFFKKQRADYNHFNQRFLGCSDLRALYQELDANADKRTGAAGIFHAGFKAFIREQEADAVIPESISRVMQIKHAKEEEMLEEHAAGQHQERCGKCQNS